jgi:hypothetical protein
MDRSRMEANITNLNHHKPFYVPLEGIEPSYNSLEDCRVIHYAIEAWSHHKDLNPALLITKQVLYQISYGGLVPNRGIEPLRVVCKTTGLPLT